MMSRQFHEHWSWKKRYANAGKLSMSKPKLLREELGKAQAKHICTDAAEHL
jgi:hypothetical protein